MEDLPSEVFLHVPVKPLLRFKCVCRAWNRVLCDPQFDGMHLARYKSSEKLLLSTSFRFSFCFYSVDYEASNDNGSGPDAVKLQNSPVKDFNSKSLPEILGSCNGMLCLKYRKRYASENRDRGRELILWNPSIGDSKLIPDPNPTLDDSHLLGFCYDSSINDYKIVRIFNSAWKNGSFRRFNHQKESRVDVYSLKTNSWKVIGHDVPEILLSNYTHREGCSANGSIYWLVCYYSQLESYHRVVGFDLKDNKFREPQLLPNDFTLWCPAILKALGESLGIYQFNYATKKFVVWTMKSGSTKEEWIKLVTFYTYPDPQVYEDPRPVYLMKNGKVLVHLFQRLVPTSNIRNKFVLYDPKRHCIEDVHIRGISDVPWCNEITYTESLVSPNYFSGEGN